MAAYCKQNTEGRMQHSLSFSAAHVFSPVELGGQPSNRSLRMRWQQSIGCRRNCMTTTEHNNPWPRSQPGGIKGFCFTQLLCWLEFFPYLEPLVTWFHRTWVRYIFENMQVHTVRMSQANFIVWGTIKVNIIYQAYSNHQKRLLPRHSLMLPLAK
jgi:hypothetical protein